MGRLNLTLDDGTIERLNRHARSQRKPAARVAREMIREGLERREELQRRRKLAEDYAAGRSDARALLQDFEVGQLALLDEDEA